MKVIIKYKDGTTIKSFYKADKVCTIRSAIFKGEDEYKVYAYEKAYLFNTTVYDIEITAN